MMNKNITAGLLTFFLSIISGCVSAADKGGGTTGVQFLKNTMSARALGMGGAYVGLADDIYAVNYNPAGLGQLKAPEVSAMYMSGFDDASLGNFSAAWQMPFLGFGQYAQPVLAVSAISSSAGDLVYKPESGDSQSWKTYDAQNDLAVTLSYGENFFVGDMDFEGYSAEVEQYLGANIKYIRSEIVEKYRASAFAADVGWLGRIPNLTDYSSLAFGLYAGNVGSGLKYVNERTDLPITLRAGPSWQVTFSGGNRLTLLAECDYYPDESLFEAAGGAELLFGNIINFRAGYRYNEDNPAMTVGIGVEYDDASIDFASSLGGDVYNPLEISFSYRFSGLGRTYEKKNNFKSSEESGPVAAPVGAPNNYKTKDDIKDFSKTKRVIEEKKEDSGKSDGSGENKFLFRY